MPGATLLENPKSEIQNPNCSLASAARLDGAKGCRLRPSLGSGIDRAEHGAGCQMRYTDAAGHSGQHSEERYHTYD